MARLPLTALALACLTFAAVLAAEASELPGPRPIEETIANLVAREPAAPAEDAASKAEARAKKLALEQARVQQAVDDLRPVVARLRGLAWKQPVQAAVMTRESLRAFMLAEMEKEVTPEEWARDTRILRRLGLLRPEEDLKGLVLHMYQSAVAGFYNPETKNLYVIEGLDLEGQQPTMVHELVHALEDQHFDLQAMEEPYRENDPDRQFAIRCLWEGSAEFARRLYQDLEPDVAEHYYAAAAKNPAQAAQRAMMRTVPTHMLLSTLLHYRNGPNFVSHLLRADGYHAGMQKLLADPPTTQEHFLHPHKWLGAERDHPRTVVWGGDVAATLGDGWTKLDEHSVGELDLAVYLDYFLGDKDGRLNELTSGFGMFVDAQSNRAAQGWDAGRTQYVEKDDDHMVLVHAFAFDTEKDAEEAARFLGAARRKANGDTWKGEGWIRDENATATHQTYDYRGVHGRGRILQRGREVLLLDGAPDDRFEQAWAEVRKTTFTQHPDDRGDDAAEPFDGYAVVDRRRGLGLMLPGEGWEARKGGRSPASFATATKGSIQVGFIVVDQEVSQAGLPNMARMVLGAMFNEKAVRATSIMGHEGIRHPLPARPGSGAQIHIAADAARTYIVTVAGPTSELARASDEITRLLTGMPGPLPAPAPADGPPDLEGEGAPPAGLRSIPGY